MARLPAILAPGHRHAAIAVAFLILAIVLGGGGTPNPQTEVLLETLTGLAALAWLWSPGRLHLPPDRMLWLLASLLALVPALQLIPLPPSLWQALPGREAQIAALELADAADSWRPLSVSPARTLASLLSLGPPLLLMLMTGALSTRERQWLIVTVAGMAILSSLLGAMQISTGQAAPQLYEKSAHFVVTGFQANRNSTADLLLIGLLALAAVAAGRKARQEQEAAGRASSAGAPSGNAWLGGAALLVLVACVLTASRTGIALIVPVLIACSFIFIPYRGSALNRGHLAAAGGILALVLGAIFLFNHNSALQKVAARFGLPEDARPGLWADTWYAIGQYWPFGSGMGTFVPTFVALEPLEAVDPSIPNRAHNDYFELMLEAGALGVAMFLACVAVVLFMAWRSWKGNAGERWQTLFGIATLAVVAAHSTIDYPLRSMTVASLAAVAVGLLARPPVRARSGQSRVAGQAAHSS